MMFVRKLFSVATAVATGLLASPAWAEQSGAATFYDGKSISILVASTPGGAYDMYARLISRHYARFIPGSPSIIVKNMPGATSMRAAQYLSNMSPKDGTELGALLNTVPITQLMKPEAFSMRAQDFTWIGAVASPANVLTVWHTTGVRSVADAKQKLVTIGNTAAGSTKEMVPRLANRLLGTKFKVVGGYQGSAEIGIALERGEIGGDGSTAWTTYQIQKADWVREGKIIPLFQMMFSRTAQLPNVPTLMELAQNDEQREILRILTTAYAIGVPLAAPPGLSSDHAGILRRGFDLMNQDSAFLADAEKLQLEVGPTKGSELQDMVTRVMNSSPEIVEKFKQAISSD
jgi:tripartite-type tricarboxylate transporter receptor subunit TctC